MFWTIVYAENSRYVGCGAYDCDSGSSTNWNIVCHYFWAQTNVSLTASPFVPYLDTGSSSCSCASDRSCNTTSNLCEGCPSTDYEKCTV